MANAKMTFLSQSEIALIHTQSLRALEEIGIKVHSIPTLKLLAAKGAHVDFDTGVAKLSETVVTDALNMAPKTFKLCARDSKHDLTLPAHPYPYATTSGLAVFVTDYKTGEYRHSTCRDIAEFSRLSDALSPDFLWTALTANDVPKRAHGPHELWQTMQNTLKHVQGVTVQSARDAQVQIELAALVAGGREALKTRPLMSVISCPLAPLSFEAGAIEAQVEFARAGIPICSMSMSLGGLSAPVTVAGMMMNANAENLASLVITQAASPGAPHVYTSESAPMDMLTGNINYGAPEKALVSFGLGQMARHYDLPCLVADTGFGDNVSGGLEGVQYIANQFIGPTAYTDIITGMGCIDNAKGVSFEQLVIDAYMWDFFKDFLKSVEISEEMMGLDAIRAVGHGGDFLSSDHTLTYLRSDLTQWDQAKLDLLSLDEKEMAEAANKVVRETLADHVVPPLDDGLVKAAEKIIKSYEKEISDL
ncbi:MAG: trimethylamine methyltransferase family protein [Deltaproteobacteria bacterium]|nr:trimethylamine methyltransferase family protein [Deltaproteobacteria bacterium]